MKCKVPNCEQPATAKGYCSKHYHQIVRHGKLTPERERMRYAPTDICCVDGCKNRPKARGYCDKHYRQIRIYGKIIERTIHDKNNVIVNGDTANIILYDPQSCKPIARAIIDACDADKVKGYKWFMDKNGYVRSSKLKTTLHRHLLGATKDKDIDHINHNPLDNRRCNLRVCDRSQNNMNRTRRSRGAARFKGIYWSKRMNKWHVRVWLNKKAKHIGFFDSLEDAIKARMRSERIHYGEYACRN